MFFASCMGRLLKSWALSPQSMTTNERKPFAIRPHWTEGGWLTDADRFYSYAVEQLVELESFVERVNTQWPLPLDQALKQANAPRELWELAHRRNMISDSVRIYAAMAVEGFLNFYGVVRLGEEEFTCHFERLGLIPKLRQLLLFCDSVSISATDTLVRSLQRLAESRNSLVHPKTKEIRFDQPERSSGETAIPGAAREAVAEMHNFFDEFIVLVPDAAHLLPR